MLFQCDLPHELYEVPFYPIVLVLNEESSVRFQHNFSLPGVMMCFVIQIVSPLPVIFISHLLVRVYLWIGASQPLFFPQSPVVGAWLFIPPEIL